MTGTLHEDQYTFLIVSCSFLLWKKNISDQSCRRQPQNTFYVQNPPPENRVIYEMTWKKHFTVGQGTGGNIEHTHCMLET